MILNGEPVQYSSEDEYYSLNFFDLSQENDDQQLYELINYLTKKPFSLINSPLFYAAYIKTATETFLYFKKHHLITDAWSIILTGDRILEYYLRLKNNEAIDRINEPSFFKALELGKEYSNSKRFFNDKMFWGKKITSNPEFLFFKSKPSHYSTRTQRANFLISDDVSCKANRFCNENKVSILVVFVAAFSSYLYQITAKKNITIGTTVLNRSNYKEKKQLACL